MRILVLISLLMMTQGCATPPNSQPDRTYMEAATLWTQTAAEVKALYHQGYNLAKLTLDQELRKKRSRKTAVVLDADETVLDNSPYQATGVLTNKDYESKSWGVWVQMAKAKALPGSVDFLKYAHKRGVEIFIVSNRKAKHLDATYKNLINLGIPVKKENVLLKTTTSGKSVRRDMARAKHDVLLYVGDVLADFHSDFEHKNHQERDALVETHKAKLGTKYIMMPNPMYGDWESAIYGYDFKKSADSKQKARRDHLRPIE